MPKRKMGTFVPAPDELISEMQGNKKQAIQEVRNQCFGNKPRKQIFLESDIMPALMQVLKDSSEGLQTKSGGDKEDDERLCVMSTELLCSLVKAEDSTIPHSKILAAAVPLLFKIAYSGPRSTLVAALKAITSLFEQLHCILLDERTVGMSLEAEEKAIPIHRAVSEQHVLGLIPHLEGTDTEVAVLVKKFLIHLPKTPRTLGKSTERILALLAKDLDANLDETSSVTLAAFVSMMTFHSIDGVLKSSNEDIYRLIQQSLLQASPDTDSRLFCCKILCERFRLLYPHVPSLVCKPPPSRDPADKELALRCMLALKDSLAKSSPNDHRISELLTRFLNIFREDDIKEKLGDSGLPVLLLKQADSLLSSRPMDAIHALNAASLMGGIVLRRRMIGHTANVLKPEWTSLMGKLKEEFNLKPKNEVHKEAQDMLRQTVLIFWMSLTSAVSKTHCLKDYFKGMHLLCLDLASQETLSPGFRRVALSLFTNLITQFTLPQGQTMDDMTAAISDAAQKLLEILRKIPLEPITDAPTSVQIMCQVFGALTNLAVWDDWPKSGVTKHFPFAMLAVFLKGNEPSLKVRAMELIENLSNNFEGAEQKSFAEWVEAKEIVDLLCESVRKTQDWENKNDREMDRKSEEVLFQNSLFNTVGNLAKGGLPELYNMNGLGGVMKDLTRSIIAHCKKHKSAPATEVLLFVAKILSWRSRADRSDKGFCPNTAESIIIEQFMQSIDSTGSYRLEKDIDFQDFHTILDACFQQGKSRT